MGYNERRPVTAQARLRLHLCGARPGFIGGALLVVFGTLLFLDNLGILPISVFDAFWPMILLYLGGYGLLRSSSVSVRIWSVASIVAGVLLILDAFHVVNVTAATLWPLGLIATGAVMLAYRMRWSEMTERFSIGANTSSRPVGNTVSEFSVFSQVKRQIQTQNFEGGDLSTVFGAINLDMRWAGISTPGKIAVLEANAAFGAIELRIPETWRLSLQGSAAFGAYEDKTIPPRPEPGVETPTLVIKGGTAFGAVVIRN
jgi:predicted membrane protein